MDPNDLNTYENTLYDETCKKCGKMHLIYSQKDHLPEYYTPVYVVCECGELVLFNLPVN